MTTDVQLVILLLLNNKNGDCQSNGKLLDMMLVARFFVTREGKTLHYLYRFVSQKDRLDFTALVTHKEMDANKLQF